jgi:chromosome segregation ATPase
VNKSRAKLVRLLEAKRSLFEEMNKILLEQKNLLVEKEIEEFRERCETIDDIIEKIKNIDYDIARLETDDMSLSGMLNSGDSEIKKILGSVTRISKRNFDLIDELTERLKTSCRDLKGELGDTVEMSKIGGYKAATQPSPVYFDKTS